MIYLNQGFINKEQFGAKNICGIMEIN
jgi:hypothetical protein